MPENAIRCKFKCVEATEVADGKRTLFNYKFFPVVEGSEENKKFFAFTPAGILQVSSVIEKSFDVGKEYYLDISSAKAGE